MRLLHWMRHPIKHLLGRCMFCGVERTMRLFRRDVADLRQKLREIRALEDQQ